MWVLRLSLSVLAPVLPVLGVLLVRVVCWLWLLAGILLLSLGWGMWLVSFRVDLAVPAPAAAPITVQVATRAPGSPSPIGAVGAEGPLPLSVAASLFLELFVGAARWAARATAGRG